MSIGALVPYFGQKRKHAPRIVNELCAAGMPAFFAEPFCGSMAVSLAMPEVPTHLVNDLNGMLTNLAIVLSWEYEGPQLVERLRRSLCSEAVYERACRVLTGPTPANERSEPEALAWAYAVSQWLGPNGAPQGDERFCVRFGPGGGDPATRLRAAADALDGFRERLRRFTILNRDAFGVLEKIADEPNAAVYADPPYLMSTRGAGAYRHDFEDHGGGIFKTQQDDHDRLSEALGRFEHARVVVSYYDDSRLEELYPAPRWRKVVIGAEEAGLANASGETGRDRVEVLLINDGATR